MPRDEPLEPGEMRFAFEQLERIANAAETVAEFFTSLKDAKPAPAGIQPQTPGQAFAGALAGLFTPPGA